MSDDPNHPLAGQSTLTVQVLSGGGRGHRSVVDASALANNPGILADCHGATDPGRVRASNQDQFLVAALEHALFIEGASLPSHAGTRLTDTPDGRLLIVADGIGGHGGGEFASAAAIIALAEYAFEVMAWAMNRSERTEQEVEGLLGAVVKAQARARRVLRRKNEVLDHGTPLTMAYVSWPYLHLVHVGASRSYLLREGKLHRLARDHTLAQQLVDDQARTPEEAERSRYSHVLANAAAGDTDDLDVELHRVRLEIDDQLMLCTDGLYDMVSDTVLVEHLRKTHEPAEAVVHGLIRAANEAGGRDNVTVVLARF